MMLQSKLYLYLSFTYGKTDPETGKVFERQSFAISALLMFAARKLFAMGAVLCIVECLAAPLASTS